MAQFIYDIGAQTVGQPPAGWTVDGFTASEFQIVEDLGSPSGKAINVALATEGRRVARFDAPGQVLDSEVLVRFKTTRLDQSTAKEIFPAILRQKDAVASLKCYYCKVGTYSSAPLKRGTLGRYNTAVTNHPAFDIGDNSNVGNTSLWTWMRLRVSGTTLYVKLWNDGDLEPAAWTNSRTDGVLTLAGYVGIFNYYNLNDYRISHFSVGTDGDTAPYTASTPTADFSGTPTSGTAPLSVAFTDSSTAATSWSWTFGDGGTSTDQHPTHIYSLPGLYSVTLSINGGEDSLTKTDYIAANSATTVTIDGDFNGGNLDKIISSVDESAGVTINIKPRLQVNSYKTGARWWYFAFKVENAAGVRPQFSLDWTAHVAESTDGVPTLGPRATWRPCYSYTPNDPDSWVYASAQAFSAPYVTWQFPAAFAHDVVYVSYRPFCHQPVIDAWIAELHTGGLIQDTPSSTDYSLGSLVATQDERGVVIPSLPIPAFKFGAGTDRAVLTSGVHPCEDHGTLVLIAAVNWLLGADPDAVELRSRFTFYVYPLINPQGRYGRNYRGTFEAGKLTVDPNRDWSGTPVLTCVQIVRNAIIADAGVPVVCLDFHGHHQWTSGYGLYLPGADAASIELGATYKNSVATVIPGLFFAPLTGTYLSTYINSLGSPMLAVTSEINDANADASGGALIFGEQLAKSLESVAISSIPNLTSPTATATGATTATASVTTDDGNGTLYFLASTNATESVSTVKAALSQAVTAAGAQSISLSALDPETTYYVHFVQINGASLESASVVSTAAFTTDAIPVKGATITLHAGTTPQANLTNILALWWDATTPSGAPDYSTTTASTDASGVLTLDLDATTTLSIGDSGFLLLYKLNVTDHRDSLVFAGRVAVSDIA